MKTKNITISLLAGLAMITTFSYGADYDRVKVSEETYKKMFGKREMKEAKTDPELAETMKRFVYGDIVKQCKLPDDTRQLVTIVILATNQHESALKKAVKGALKTGVTPLQIREAIYHVAPYIGFGRAFEALDEINDVFKDKKIKLPLENQGTVTEETRFKKGLDIQVKTFGDRILKGRESSPADLMHIQDNLASFCFGDTYTRGTFDMKMRELLTMSALAALGTEPQLKGHIAGNFAVGNSRETIIGAFTAALPYIGFPRTLNAIRCLEEVEAGMKKSQPVETKKAKTEAYSVPPKEEIIDQLKKLGGAVMPLGDINPYNKYFTGTTYLAKLTDEKLPVANVTFVNGAHTFWHIHNKSCQVLVAESGRGYYQIWGQEPKELLPGQTVTIPEGTKHWHGAAPNTMFQHISIMNDRKDVSTDWLEPVKEEEFNKLK